MTTEIMALHRKVQGFRNSVSELMRAQTVPAPGAPLSDALNNRPNEEKNIEVYAAVQGEPLAHT